MEGDLGAHRGCASRVLPEETPLHLWPLKELHGSDTVRRLPLPFNTHSFPHKDTHRIYLDSRATETMPLQPQWRGVQEHRCVRAALHKGQQGPPCMHEPSCSSWGWHCPDSCRSRFQELRSRSHPAPSAMRFMQRNRQWLSGLPTPDTAVSRQRYPGEQTWNRGYV